MTTGDRSTARRSRPLSNALRVWSRPLRRSLTILTRPHGPAGSGWRAVIEKVALDLDGLNRSTESDFLAVGGSLMDFRSTVRRIASDSAVLTELISGEHGRNAAQALTQVLDHSRGLEAQAEEAFQALGEVYELSHQVRLAFGGLGNTVSTFRTLCTLTRIETARLGSTGADFSDLAAEVAQFSESIQSSGQRVLDVSASLEQSVQAAIRNGSAARARQIQALPALLSGVQHGMEAFEERRRGAVESSIRQTAEYGGLCDAIDGVVRSVQFHDITRQQVEHVAQALRQLGSGAGDNPADAEALPRDAPAILALQSSQLAAAAKTFASSIERMEMDLATIATRAGRMAETGRALMGISADEHDSFFLRMEGEFTKILEMLGSSAGAQAEVASTAARLEETIGSMRNSVAEIRGIEIMIQRIAINATIRAAHLGTAGDALNVIAEAMQYLALDSNTRTEEAAGSIAAIGLNMRRVSGGAAYDASGSHPSTKDVIDQMRRAVLELHSSSECSFSRANQIAALGARLAGEIGAVRGGLSAGPLFEQVVGRARAGLERIGAQGGAGDPGGVDAAPAQQLENLARHYTMQTERDVHEAVARGAAEAAGAPLEAPKTAPDEGDLGDNVELF